MTYTIRITLDLRTHTYGYIITDEHGKERTNCTGFATHDKAANFANETLYHLKRQDAAEQDYLDYMKED